MDLHDFPLVDCRELASLHTNPTGSRFEHRKTIAYMQAFDFKVFELTFRVRRLFIDMVRAAQEQRAVFESVESQVRRPPRTQCNTENPSSLALHVGEDAPAPT